jgi:hypothetical protein
MNTVTSDLVRVGMRMRLEREPLNPAIPALMPVGELRRLVLVVKPTF